MSEIQYLNEHLWPGMLGHFFVVLAFVSALGASVAYYFNEKDPHAGWLQWGRRAFYTHAISVVGIVSMMLLMLFNHYYEYKYAFEHLNDSMPLKYMLDLGLMIPTVPAGNATASPVDMRMVSKGRRIASWMGARSNPAEPSVLRSGTVAFRSSRRH